MARSQGGEFDLIAGYLKPIAGAPDALGLGDDAAVLTPPAGARIAATADALVEGVHFLSDDPPETVGKKLLRVNLSDLAAMGARPWRHVMTFATPAPLDQGWFAAFCRGLGEDQRRFSSALVGGDMTRTMGPKVLTVTAMGLIEGEPLRRSGAQVGDDVWVSGAIGDAFLGLQALTGGWEAGRRAAFVAHRYRTPEPRVALGRALIGLATACIDVSDGLLADLGHIADASGVGVTVDMADVPLSEAGRAFVEEAADRNAARRRLITGGDDYELAFTAPQGARALVADAGRRAGVPVTRTGFVRAGEGVRCAGGEGDMSGQAGWRHF